MLFHLAKIMNFTNCDYDMTSSNFGSLWNVSHPVISNVVFKRYLNS